jgi:hypothetical protein
MLQIQKLHVHCAVLTECVSIILVNCDAESVKKLCDFVAITFDMFYYSVEKSVQGQLYQVEIPYVM